MRTVLRLCATGLLIASGAGCDSGGKEGNLRWVGGSFFRSDEIEITVCCASGGMTVSAFAVTDFELTGPSGTVVRCPWRVVRYGDGKVGPFAGVAFTCPADLSNAAEYQVRAVFEYEGSTYELSAVMRSGADLGLGDRWRLEGVTVKRRS